MLQHPETTEPAPGALACVAETRIGPSAVFGQTRTEPLACLTSTSHRACGNSWSEVASDLGLYTQPDPIGLAGRYDYVGDRPLLFTDALGLQPSYSGDDASWCASFGLLRDFIFEQGSDYRRYPPGSPRTEAMKYTPAVNKARSDFFMGGCKTSVSFTQSFGLPGLFRSGFDPVLQQVGGFSGTVEPSRNGCAKFTIRNTLSMSSFFYHLRGFPSHARRGLGGCGFSGSPVSPSSFFGNIDEEFWWLECSCCR